MPDIVDDEAAINVFDELKKLNIKRTWISYTLPFLLFISIGYVLSLFIGDIALFILTQTIL